MVIGAMRHPHLPYGVILSGAQAAKWAERSRRIPSLYQNLSLVVPRDSSTPFHLPPSPTWNSAQNDTLERGMMRSKGRAARVAATPPLYLDVQRSGGEGGHVFPLGR